MSQIKQRAEYMTQAQKDKMKDFPRTHDNCLDLVGVARPGKTAQDRARRHAR